MLTFISVRLIKKSQVGICRLNTFFTPPIVISISPSSTTAQLLELINVKIVAKSEEGTVLFAFSNYLVFTFKRLKFATISISNISYFVESADKEQFHNCSIRNSLLVMALEQFCKIRTRKKTGKNQLALFLLSCVRSLDK